jgi:mono/diheme cytochrome c family protein
MRHSRLLLVGMVALGGCAGTQIPRDRIQDPGELMFNGYTNPAANCYKCHGGDGTGTLRGANLAKRVPDLTVEQIETTIKEGKGFMPSFIGQLNDQEISLLANWLHTTFPKKPSEQPKS